MSWPGEIDVFTLRVCFIPPGEQDDLVLVAGLPTTEVRQFLSASYTSALGYVLFLSILLTNYGMTFGKYLFEKKRKESRSLPNIAIQERQARRRGPHPSPYHHDYPIHMLGPQI